MRLKPASLADTTVPPELPGAEALAFAPDWVCHGPLEAAPPAAPSHPAFDRLMARIPIELHHTFTRQQLVALSRASVPINSPHAVNVRVSVPFFGKRFYVTLLAGRERRSLKRLTAEGQLLTSKLFSLDSKLMAPILFLSLFVLAFGAYILRAALDVDTSASEPALHELINFIDRRHIQ